MKKHVSSSPFIFYSAALLLFLLDLCAFSFLEKQLIHSLLCFFVLQFIQQIRLPRIAATLALLSLAPLIYYGRFGLTLIYLLPATALGIKINRSLYPNPWHAFALLTACLIAHLWGIEYALLHLKVSVYYTVCTIIANLIVIWLLSLKQKN